MSRISSVVVGIEVKQLLTVNWLDCVDLQQAYRLEDTIAYRHGCMVQYTVQLECYLYSIYAVCGKRLCVLI